MKIKGITWLWAGLTLTILNAQSFSYLLQKSYYNSLTYSYICIAISENYLWVQLYSIYMLVLLYLAPLAVMSYTYTGSCLALYRSAVSARKMQGDGRYWTHIRATWVGQPTIQGSRMWFWILFNRPQSRLSVS